MNTKQGPAHVVVDGSNIATEGRSMPSLAQLSEAVAGFMDEHPDTAITVVVDATFGHRIDKQEVAEFEAGISNNELVAPPAGAVGRGDAFVLGIADKAKASVLSNDSFQEFHGEYTWLFDEGRLIGGKPVPHVGWVWVERVPVRGPISRKATRGSGGTGARRSAGGRSRRGRTDENAVRTGSREASGPMPKPTSPPPGRAAAKDAEPSSNAPESWNRSAGAAPRSAPRGGDAVNELMPFLDFVESHPVGTSVNGTVDAYSSHGAYITISDTDVRGYIPLRLMAEPAPRSAKSLMKMGESVTVVVVSFAPARRSIDCAMPDLAADAISAATDEVDGDVDDRDTADVESTGTTSATGSTGNIAAKKSAGARPTAKKTAAKKTAAKKTAAKKTVAKKTTAKNAAAKKTAAGRTAPNEPVSNEKSATGTTATRRTATRKATVATTTAATSTAAIEKTAAEKSATKSAASKRAAPKKTSATKSPVEQAASKKTAATKSVETKVAANKTAAKKTAAKKTAARKTAGTKKAAAKKIAARKAATAKTAAAKTAAKKAGAATTTPKKAAARKPAVKKATDPTGSGSDRQ